MDFGKVWGRYQQRFNTRVQIAFSLTWLYYVMVYGCALLYQLGWI